MVLLKPNTLSQSQYWELADLMATTKDITIYRRTKVILYRNACYTAEEIQEHTEYSERAQQYWLRRYREEGVSGLFERPRSGRPKPEATQATTPEATQATTPEATQATTPEVTQATTPEVTQAADQMAPR